MKQDQEYYVMSVDEIYQTFHTSQQGLNSIQVQENQLQYGLNQLESGKKKSLLVRFLEQFKDLMIIILLFAAILSVVASKGEDWIDAIIIVAVVILNACFGVYQEGKVEQAIEALKDMSSPHAKVRRNGQVIEIDAKELVPGDIVILEAGDVVPADLRLIEINSLKVEEAALTGESVPVEKSLTLEVFPDATIGERYNMAYQNSNVTYGRATGVVVSTGMNTEVGHIAKMLKNTDKVDTPLKQNLNHLSKVLSYIILIIAIITFVVGVFVQKQPPVTGLLTAVALAVAAIPEGLPAIVTVVLSLGTQSLAKQKAIVRKLPAVETLGSTEIICSDKTGTLTLNQMTVENLFYNQETFDRNNIINNQLLSEIMCLANDTKISSDGQLIGDPTETALVQFCCDQQINVEQLLNNNPRIDEIPFDSERKLMSTINQTPNGLMVCTKGAPDQLLQRITRINIDGEIRQITKEDQALITKVNDELAKQALRVLMFAYKPISSIPNNETIEQDLIFVGMVGMIDPEREEAKQAVQTAKAAGIRPIMITGDHQTTAQAIALRLGIIDDDSEGHVLTGSELDQMDDDTFNQCFQKYQVYARVSPEHKVRIVKAWQGIGKVVAMTGDGVNDAPSLKQADIGIGMGITGTEVSKGAADIVLADDNFATIIVAVKEGRKIFANIQKTIQYLLSANMAEVLTIFLATLFGWDVLFPIQLLWINLVTDTLPAIALGIEPAEANVMHQTPRGRKASFFAGGVGCSIIYQGILQTMIVLGVYYLAIKFPVHHEADLIHQDALTMSYITLGLIQLMQAFNVKSLHQSIFKINPFKNKLFNFAIIGSAILLMSTIFIPGFNQVFHVSYLNLSQWLIVLGGSLLMIVVVEIVKLIQRKVYKY